MNRSEWECVQRVGKGRHLGIKLSYVLVGGKKQVYLNQSLSAVFSQKSENHETTSPSFYCARAHISHAMERVLESLFK